jgi:hypothetical protein
MLIRTVRGVMVALLLMMALAGGAGAGALEDGMAAYLRGDHATAHRLLRPLADQGDANAQILLGRMYSQGQGVTQDYALAMQWFRKAADQGYGVAQSSLGLMYEEGRGVTQDYALAMQWFRKAADQGYANAQILLGVMYSQGQGMAQDNVRAHMWYNLAASRFSATENENRERVVAARAAVAKLMTPGQIAEAQRLAREWKPTPPARTPGAQ